MYLYGFAAYAVVLRGFEVLCTYCNRTTALQVIRELIPQPDGAAEGPRRPRDGPGCGRGRGVTKDADSVWRVVARDVWDASFLWGRNAFQHHFDTCPAENKSRGRIEV